jgi:hypothetical protein
MPCNEAPVVAPQPANAFAFAPAISWEASRD